MKGNVINFATILILGIGSLAFTNPPATVLNETCDDYELACQRNGSSMTCCSFCELTGVVSHCKTIKLN